MLCFLLHDRDGDEVQWRVNTKKTIIKSSGLGGGLVNVLERTDMTLSCVGVSNILLNRIRKKIEFVSPEKKEKKKESMQD